MEGQSQNALGSTPAPISAGSLKPVQQGVERAGVVPTNSTPQAAGSNQLATITLSLETLTMLIQSLKPEIDATQLLTQVGIIHTPPPTSDVQSSVICSEGTKTADDSEKAERTRTGAAVGQREMVEHQLLDTGKHTEEPTVQQDEVLQIVRQINTEVEPNSTAEVPEEVAANLATGNLETTEMDMGADGDAGLNSTERVEGTIDETPGSRDEVTRVGAATVRTYQRRPAREESSGRKSAEEQSRRTSGERSREDVHSAIGPSRHRRRV